MSRQALTLNLAGLYTNPSELSEVPAGALSVADNIVIDRESVAEPRRGFVRLNASLGGSPNKLWFFQDRPIAHHGTNTMAYYDSNNWTNLTGTYSPPNTSTDPVRATQANENFYFTTASGTYKLATYNETPELAGAPKGLDLALATNGDSTAYWLANNKTVAYRVVWGKKDSNNNLILGAPSARVELTSSGLTNRTRVNVTIRVPAQVDSVTDGWFYQIYRSEQSDATPSDELQLVYEDSPSASQISTGTFTVTDEQPDELKGAVIYTAATQEGITQANEQPPLAKDITTFSGITFYANTTSRHRLFLDILSVDGSGGGGPGIDIDDTITIGGQTYTAKGAENAASRQFLASTASTPSEQIAETAQSLIRVINSDSSGGVYGYYLSGPDDLPGKILFESRTLGGSAFTAAASVASSAPTMSPDIDAATETSTNDNFGNYLYYSKVSQPEAVPLANFLRIGSEDEEIRRIVPLRNSLFIFKEDGIYKLTGTSASTFRVDLFDSSTRILAAESIAVLNNQIYVLTDQGVVTVNESGVSVRSRPIENTLLSLQGESLDNLKNLTFGISYESERKYVLFVISNSSDTEPTQAFVFNVFTNTWVRWPLQRTCGGVNPADDKLYLGESTNNYIEVERKSFSFLDHVDFGFSTTISAISSTTVTPNSGADSVEVGDICYKSDTSFATVTAVNPVAGTFTVDRDPGFVVSDSISILKAIQTRIAWVPFTLGNPAALKQFQEITLLFRKEFVGTASVLFSSDVSPAQETELMIGTTNGLWGLFAWGEVPWGGALIKKPFRLFVPRNKQRCSQLTIEFKHQRGYTQYQLNGIATTARLISPRLGRQ